MNAELWQRLKPLYSAALDLPQEGRSGYVEQMCNADPELAHALLSLLAADAGAGDTLASLFSQSSSLAWDQPARLQPGTVLVQRFRIVRHIGSGGMGDVYEALDLEIEQGTIALKTIRPAIAGQPAALARFKDEVRLARQLTGPNICRIYELYVSPGDPLCAAFLTMELLEGVTLHEHIANSSPLPVPEIGSIAEQLCAALCCIHEAGIIHRDLKPRNVMLAPHQGANRAVVMDFGLARAAIAAPDASGASLAGPALVAGTPSYMAPEQFEGGELTPATDIYALGLILYELATGVQPFAAHTPLAAAVRRAKRPETASVVRSDVPPVWDEVITCCLQYDPALRYQSAADVLTALKHPRKVVWQLGRDHRLVLPRRLLLIVGIALLVVFALGATLLIRNAQERKLSPDAAHWYTLGMNALREGSYLRATKLLTMVTERDPKYPVAHAALADAWTELDFTDAAQREMLLASAPSEQYGLPKPEKRYIDAVRNTLTRDYSAAAQDYEAILDKLPADSKAQGYVDLGRAYEKAGRVHETVDAYERAAALNPDDPAAFLHLGILKSRLRDAKGATDAFNRAEALYGAESDLEGMAEVAYQLGYAANEEGNYSEAKRELDKSLSIARQIPSPQLEVRTLSQLSSVAYNESRDEEAITDANKVIQLADENDLEYWSTDGLIRLGNAYLDKQDFGAAEPVLQQALHKAQGNGHPRLEASAELTLASLRNQQRRWDEQISFAQRALKYYQDYGFMNAADSAETLILRGERDKGDYAKALQAGSQLLRIADQTHSMSSVAMAQEFVGYVNLRMDRYPEALTLFEDAVRNFRALGQDASYEQALCAETLWRLGRYDEAQTALAAVPSNMSARSDLSTIMAATRARILVSQGKDIQALSLIRSVRATNPNARASLNELDPIEIRAELNDGSLADAARHLQSISEEAKAQGRTDISSRNQLLQAELDLKGGDYAGAQNAAELAGAYFAQRNIWESTAMAWLLQAEAAHGLNNAAQTLTLGKKSVDIFRQTQQSWGVPAFHTYLTRPDRQRTMHTLAQLLGQSGDVPDELTK